MSNDPLDYKPLNREAYVMVKPDELARLQDENRRLRAFVEKFAEWNWISTPMPFHHLLDWQDKAAALLASMKPAEE